MIIAYNILGKDFYSNQVHSRGPNVSTCSGCGRLLNPKVFNPKFKIGKARCYDYLAAMHDGEDIVSLKFKEFCERWNYKNIEFVEIPSEPNWFLFRPKQILEFDSVKAGIKFENFCSVCKRYYDVYGLMKVILKNISHPIEDGFFRTDLEFAWGDKLSPRIIIGINTFEHLKKENFRGLSIRPITLH